MTPEEEKLSLIGAALLDLRRTQLQIYEDLGSSDDDRPWEEPLRVLLLELPKHALITPAVWDQAVALEALPQAAERRQARKEVYYMSMIAIADMLKFVEPPQTFEQWSSNSNDSSALAALACDWATTATLMRDPRWNHIIAQRRDDVPGLAAATTPLTFFLPPLTSAAPLPAEQLREADVKKVLQLLHDTAELGAVCRDPQLEDIVKTVESKFKWRRCRSWTAAADAPEIAHARGSETKTLAMKMLLRLLESSKTEEGPRIDMTENQLAKYFLDAGASTSEEHKMLSDPLQDSTTPGYRDGVNAWPPHTPWENAIPNSDALMLLSELGEVWQQLSTAEKKHRKRILKRLQWCLQTERNDGTQCLTAEVIIALVRDEAWERLTGTRDDNNSDSEETDSDVVRSEERERDESANENIRPQASRSDETQSIEMPPQTTSHKRVRQPKMKEIISRSRKFFNKPPPLKEPQPLKLRQQKRKKKEAAKEARKKRDEREHEEYPDPEETVAEYDPYDDKSLQPLAETHANLQESDISKSHLRNPSSPGPGSSHVGERSLRSDKRAGGAGAGAEEMKRDESANENIRPQASRNDQTQPIEMPPQTTSHISARQPTWMRNTRDESEEEAETSSASDEASDDPYMPQSMEHEEADPDYNPFDHDYTLQSLAEAHIESESPPENPSSPDTDLSHVGERSPRSDKRGKESKTTEAEASGTQSKLSTNKNPWGRSERMQRIKAKQLAVPNEKPSAVPDDWLWKYIRELLPDERYLAALRSEQQLHEALPITLDAMKVKIKQLKEKDSSSQQKHEEKYDQLANPFEYMSSENVEKLYKITIHAENMNIFKHIERSHYHLNYLEIAKQIRKTLFEKIKETVQKLKEMFKVEIYRAMPAALSDFSTLAEMSESLAKIIFDFQRSRRLLVAFQVLKNIYEPWPPWKTNQQIESLETDLQTIADYIDQQLQTSKKTAGKASVRELKQQILDSLPKMLTTIVAKFTKEQTRLLTAAIIKELHDLEKKNHADLSTLKFDHLLRWLHNSATFEGR